LYEAKGDSQKALSTYQKALAKNPKSPLLLAGLAGLHAGHLKDPARSMDYARQAWAASSTPAMAAQLAPIAYKAGEFKWANGRFLEAVRNEISPEALFYKGLTSFALGSISQSRDDLSNAARSPNLPKNLGPLVNAALDIARFHLSELPPEAGERAVNAARAIDPNFIPASIASGLLLERKNDYVSARRVYENVLSEYPGLLIAQRQLAILLGEKLPDDAKARQLATALRTDFPDDAALIRILGKIAYRQGDYREAVRLLNSAASRQPNDSDLLYHLGMAQFHAKDQGAKANLSRAMSMEPNGSLAADARKALAELK
jgi:tetratricopeptide (TPR) repeat protein